ncbi:hypothetical protein ACFYKX_26415 [Cytobacillus sp. FJAT-54145]|uniref:Uncharacterized protein n=1 Tax=Cytobacillus spartinae TaxID=3299023 RepID=A0ABW6KIP0_9BACI
MDRELDDLINEFYRDVDSLDRDSLISLFDDMIPKIKGLQEENCDMAEKHAEKDIFINNSLNIITNKRKIEILKYRDECLTAYEKHAELMNKSMMDLNLGALQAVRKVMSILGEKI